MSDAWLISPNDRREVVQESINKFQQKHGSKGGATWCAIENLQVQTTDNEDKRTLCRKTSQAL